MQKAEVVCHPDVMSGDPCIRGTRVTVETILANLAAGETPEAIQAAYPTLPDGAVEAAVSWARWQLTLSNGWRPPLTDADLAEMAKQLPPSPDDYNLEDLDEDGTFKKGSE